MPGLVTMMCLAPEKRSSVSLTSRIDFGRAAHDVQEDDVERALLRVAQDAQIGEQVEHGVEMTGAQVDDERRSAADRSRLRRRSASAR